MARRKSLPSSKRQKILDRDKLCGVCRVAPAAEVHHIEAVYRGGGDEENNLVGLCGICHRGAPDTREEYLPYTKGRGLFWKLFMLGFDLKLNYPEMSRFQAIRFMHKVGVANADPIRMLKYNREYIANDRLPTNRWEQVLPMIIAARRGEGK